MMFWGNSTRRLWRSLRLINSFLHKIAFVTVVTVTFLIIIKLINRQQSPLDFVRHRDDVSVNVTFYLTARGGNTSAEHRSLTFAPKSKFRFNFTINNKCLWQPILMIVVCSSFSHIFERQVIRSTWGSQEELFVDQVMIMFLIGKQKDRLPHMQSLVERENEIYMDIIQSNFLDTYDNLTLKSISLLQWANTYCKTAQFVLKVDDDVYVNVKVLLAALWTQDATTKFLFGSLRNNGGVLRNETQPMRRKWALTYEEYPNNTFPAYLLGAAYVISGPAVSDLYKATSQVTPLKIEDVYITGMCSKAAGIRLVNRNDLFFHSKRACKIKNLAVSSLTVKPAMFFYIHRILKDASKLCP